MTRPAPDTADHSVDEQLVARVAKGDVSAFEELYEGSSTLLFTLALRMLGTREEAADAVQEVYLEIWRKAARYDVARGTPVAWMIMLTRQRAVERLRARRDRQAGKAAPPEKPLAPVLELSSPSTGESPQAAARRQTIAHAYTALPAEERQVLEWGYFDGLTYADMATRLRAPIPAVKDRIRHGMEHWLATLRTTWSSPPRYGT